MAKSNVSSNDTFSSTLSQCQGHERKGMNYLEQKYLETYIPVSIALQSLNSECQGSIWVLNTGSKGSSKR